MATYTITYSCGHEATKKLFGPHADRERYIAWAGKSGLCDACKAADRADERAKQLMIAEECEAEHNLPQLTGSEKQIAWARTIRATAAKELDGIFTDKAIDPKAEPVAKVMAYLFGQTDASYWIDRRATSGFWWLEKAAKEMMAAGLLSKEELRR